MSSSGISTLDLEREDQLLKLFPEPVRLHLLYKFTEDRSKSFSDRFHGAGEFIVVVYLASGVARGAYMSKPPTKAGSDEKVFLFDVTTTNATKFSPPDDCKTARLTESTLEFGKSLNFRRNEDMFGHNNWNVHFSSGEDFDTGWPDEVYKITSRHAGFKDLELFRVSGIGDVLPSPWREVSWTESTREDFRESFVSHKVFVESLSSVRVLLLGPTGAGKSTFVNSVRSVMFKRTTHMPDSGAGAPGHKLKSSIIRAGRGGPATPLTFCEVMALGEAESAGLRVSDALAVVKGHLPDGYRFQAGTPCHNQSSGYRAEPGIKDRIHGVLFVLDARKITTYDDDLQKTIRMLRDKISDQDVPQIVVLTHVDKVCHAVQEDVKYVYTSRTVMDKMQKAAEFVSMPVCNVLPVKNYAVELAPDCNTDILLLSAVHTLLQAINDTLDDQCVSSTVE